MIHRLISIIEDIFLEGTYTNTTTNIYHPQDFTEHYHGEIIDCKLDGIYTATEYKSITNTIEAYKYRSDRQYGELYVDLLVRIFEQYGILSSDDVVIMSMPMHWSRYMIRGFDHIDLLARGVSQRLGVSSIKPIRAYWTRRQSKLTKLKRMKNRENAFSLKRGVSLPKTVIIIDDIISTGSTANACAKILKSAGAEKIYGVFIASNQ